MCGCPVHLSDVASNYVIAKIYEASPETPDSTVIGQTGVCVWESDFLS